MGTQGPTGDVTNETYKQLDCMYVSDKALYRKIYRGQAPEIRMPMQALEEASCRTHRR